MAATVLQSLVMSVVHYRSLFVADAHASETASAATVSDHSFVFLV